MFGSKSATDAELRASVDALTSIGVDHEVRKLARSYASKATKSLKRYDSKAQYSLQ